MALVAYDYSDSEAEEISDEEDDENVVGEKCLIFCV